jgi:NAD(P)H dehydrogenase (quinone)
MKYVISGASAQIGQMAVSSLLEKVRPEELTMITRNPHSLSHWKEKGVNVLAGHHGDAESLRQGYRNADCVFMISSLAVGQRTKHHRETIQVAKEEGVKHIVYTSVMGAHPNNPTPSAAEHIATERMLSDSGLSYTALRNQIYSELMFAMICDQALPTGTWRHNSEHGGFAPVARADIANCVSAIMLSPRDHARVIYEITGPERYTFPKLAELAARLWNTRIEYIPMTDEDMYQFYYSIGVKDEGDPTSDFPPVCFGANELVRQFTAFEEGYCDIVSAHVEMITGAKPKSLESILTSMISQQ